MRVIKLVSIYQLLRGNAITGLIKAALDAQGTEREFLLLRGGYLLPLASQSDEDLRRVGEFVIPYLPRYYKASWKPIEILIELEPYPSGMPDDPSFRRQWYQDQIELLGM